MALSTRIFALLALFGSVASCSDFTGPAPVEVPEGSHFHLAFAGEASGRIEATGDPVAELGRFHSYAYADGAADAPEEPVFVGGFDVRSPEEGRTVVMYLSQGSPGTYELRASCLGAEDAPRCATLELMLDWNPSGPWTEATHSEAVYQLGEGRVVVTRGADGRIRGTVTGVAFAANRAARSLDRSRRLEVSGTFNARLQR